MIKKCPEIQTKDFKDFDDFINRGEDVCNHQVDFALDPTDAASAFLCKTCQNQDQDFKAGFDDPKEWEKVKLEFELNPEEEESGGWTIFFMFVGFLGINFLSWLGR